MNASATPSSSTPFHPTGFQPTDEQRAIQRSHHRITLVAANAGAAKTTTLALRIGEALARGLAPEAILALTFTPEARQVMQARLVEVGIGHAVARRVAVQTMDEFAERVLGGIEDAKPLALESVRERKAYALEALEDVSAHHPGLADQLDIRTHNVAVSQFLDNLLRAKATLALSDSQEDLDLGEAAFQLGLPLTDYLWIIEYEKRRAGSFGEIAVRAPFDATYDLACLLGDEPATLAAFPAYRLVVADELHDMNEAAFRILSAMLTRDHVYFVGVGDKDQVIHAQMGADEAFLTHRFADQFPYARSLPLTLTYRHGPHLAYAMEAFKSKPIASPLPLKTDIHELHYGDEAGACGARVVQAIVKWRAEGKRLEDCAILLRDRHQSIEIENALRQADIGYRTLTMRSYLQREEILFLRGMLAIALGNLDTVASAADREAIVEALAVFGEVPLDPQALQEAKTTIARDPVTLKYFFEGQIQRVGATAARLRISDAVNYMQALTPDTPAHVALTEICERVGMQALARRVYVHPYDADVIGKSVEGFIAAAHASGKNLRDFSAWIGAAEAFATSRRRKDLVCIDCVAHAKGKEFEHVLVPFLDVAEFPHPAQALQQEENLFYVAATRPISRLTLLAPAEPARRSRFIAQMQLGGTRTRADTAVRRNGDAAPAAPVRRDLSVSYADKDIVKAMGAKWDNTRKTWYVPEDIDATPFASWWADRAGGR